MFFNLNDNFEDIIKNTIKKDLIEITKIPTGWTNYVFKVVLKNEGTKIFRFPRNEFFAKTLIKEEAFNRFFKNKTSFKIPNIKLYSFNGKPYTMHDFMVGKTLTEMQDKLTSNEMTELGKDIAKFIYEIQSINLHEENLLEKNINFELELLSDFLKGLSEVGKQNYNLNEHDILNTIEQEKLVLAHADFNPGNILLDDNNKMFAVLDFAFVSKTSELIDLARILGRLPKKYYTTIVSEYELLFNKEVNLNDINKLITMWNYIEKKYIDYIKKHHPDIELPS